ncbi:MAG: nucleotidyltransferase family protein [Waterburya sp.]
MKLEELKAYREDILAIANQYHAPNIRVFGSVVRGEATEESDVDFLIDVPPEQTLFDLIRLTRSLSELLGCEVDVAQITVLHPRIRNQVLQDAIALELL